MAVAVRALTDIVYTNVVVVNEYVGGGWLDLGWQVEAVLLCVAALAAARHQEDVTPAPARRDGALPLLLLGALATSGLTVTDATSGRLAPATACLALFTLAAIGARLALTVHEKERAVRDLHEALREQERLAITDGLTGLHNRRFAEEMLRLEVQRCVRSGRPLSLLVVDADHFKRVNDTYGHPVGDVVLREIAQILLSAARPTDVVARYGGEEFVVLLPDVDAQAATVIAERCRSAVRARRVAADGHVISVSVSVGVASVPEHAAEVDGLMRVADRSLYLAKELGRDRVHVSMAAASQVEDLPAVAGQRTQQVATT